MAVAGTLLHGGFSARLWGFSAVDSYLRRSGPVIRLMTNAGAADLARLFEDIRYPGVNLADAALDGENGAYYFHCDDPDDPPDNCRFSFQFLEFFRDCGTGRFYDPRGIYPLLRAVSGKPFARDAGTEAPVRESPAAPPVWWEAVNPRAGRRRAIMDGALILARYFPQTGNREIREMAALFRGLGEDYAPGAEAQRLLLAGLLSAADPGPGFELLRSGGFIGEFWPELAALDDVDQSKEFHPEGNAWKHTLETFRYRKALVHTAADIRQTEPDALASPAGAAFDLRLSLGLLLHDTGKPLAESAGSRRFDGHAELGERQAHRFLERLDFAPALVNDVCYLVRNHMLPAALPRLPLIRTGGIMASSLFPTLLELYRCDESSSFKGLDGYYESSAAYQSYLKYRRNPYRSADGKKLSKYHCAVTP
jgi:poly(A) polymerase